MPDVLTSPDSYVVYALVQAFVFLLLIRLLDLYEREPLAVVTLMALAGATIAVSFARLVNGLVIPALPENVRVVYGPAVAAPAEEATKALLLVGAFAASHAMNRRFGWLEFEGVTDGIVYGAAVGLGFAFTEDLRYFLANPVTGFLDYRERVDLFGPTMLGHATYTAMFGAALGYATWMARGALRLAVPAFGLAAAVLLHAFHNGFVQGALVAWFGEAEYLRFATPAPGRPNPFWEPETVSPERTAELSRAESLLVDVVENVDHMLIGLILIGVALWLAQQRSVIRSELADEVERGLLTPEEHDLLGRYWRRSRLYWRLLRERRIDEWHSTRRLHNELVDLAFLKWRLRRANRRGLSPRLEACRLRIARLQRLASRGA